MCSLERGLYALRYAASGDVGTIARAQVRPAAGSEDLIDIVSAPGQLPGVLDAPGSVLVIVSRSPARLEIALVPVGGGSVPQAKFDLELLAAGAPVSSGLPASGAGAQQPGSGAAHMRLVAHVSRLGDVSVDEGAWIAGPTSPLPIEAVGITSLPAQVSVAAEFVNSQRPSQWVACATPDFIGTRQQASPLLGVRLRLEGAKAQQYRLNAEALFLGHPVASASGQQVSLVSDTGRDPLVGLRLWMSDVARAPAQEQVKAASRVRVFRAN